MVEEKMMRLSQAARKLNVGISTITAHLANKGYEVESSPNAKITPEQFNLLSQEFASSALEKKGASGLTIGSKHTENLVIDTESDKGIKEYQYIPLYSVHPKELYKDFIDRYIAPHMGCIDSREEEFMPSLFEKSGVLEPWSVFVSGELTPYSRNRFNNLEINEKVGALKQKAHEFFIKKTKIQDTILAEFDKNGLLDAIQKINTAIQNSSKIVNSLNVNLNSHYEELTLKDEEINKHLNYLENIEIDANCSELSPLQLISSLLLETHDITDELFYIHADSIFTDDIEISDLWELIRDHFRESLSKSREFLRQTKSQLFFNLFRKKFKLISLNYRESLRSILHFFFKNMDDVPDLKTIHHTISNSTFLMNALNLFNYEKNKNRVNSCFN